MLALLLVIGSALAVAWYGVRAGEKESVLAVGAPIAKGQVIAREDLVSLSVSGVDDSIPVSEVDTIVGQTAAVDLVERQVLTDAMVTEAPVPGDGESVVGLSLAPARVPAAGLGPGDYVDVIAIPDETGGGGKAADIDSPEPLTESALVYEVGGEAVAGGEVQVTLVVQAEDARRVAAYSTLNQVAIVETAPAGAGE